MDEDKIDKYIESFNSIYQGNNFISDRNKEIDNNDPYKKIDTFMKDFKNSGLYREPTFMEITKYPHYEKVCSNILSFYFDINREHNLGDLVLRSLLKAANIEIEKIDEIDVYTEYPTETGKSIDLVLYNKNFAIGIENKIKATVYNDLEDYAKTIESLNDNTYKLILSLRDETTIANDYGYINVTYEKFIDNLKELTKPVWDSSNKWHIFLQEFITTMENLKGEI